MNAKTKSELGIFNNALKSTQDSLREKFVENVNIVMNEIWNSLYPYADLDSVRLTVEGSDYVLKAHTINGWTDVEGTTSGGERSLAALALRIAFSFALAPNLSWLVLDEPTSSLDPIAALGVNSIVEEVRADQAIVVVSHDLRMRHVADRVIEVEAGRKTLG